MSFELTMAAAAILLGIVQVVLTAIELRRVHGVAWANSARDTDSGKTDTPLLGRLRRAQANLMETLPFFVGLILIVQIAGLNSSLTANAALAFVAARVLHLPLYAFGVPWLRGLVWTVSFIALCVIAYAVLAAGIWNPGAEASANY